MARCPVCGYDDSMTNKIEVEYYKNGIQSDPPAGAFKVKNIYAVIEDGKIKLKVEYEDE